MEAKERLRQIDLDLGGGETRQPPWPSFPKGSPQLAALQLIHPLILPRRAISTGDRWQARARERPLIELEQSPQWGLLAR